MKTKTTGLKIKRLAKLANIPVNIDEEKLYEYQLLKILKYIDLVESVNTVTVEPAYDVSTNKNITRQDEVGNGITHEKALQNGRASKGYFSTEGVFIDN